MKYFIALLAALLLNACANLMMKFGALQLDSSQQGVFDQGLARALHRHWILVLGFACFVANVLFYIYALQKLPISVAYPVMVTCGFAIIVAVAGIKLNERLSTVQWIGVAAILLGVWLVAKDASRQIGGEGQDPSAIKADS
jgi:small multidrug resistance pump